MAARFIGETSRIMFRAVVDQSRLTLLMMSPDARPDSPEKAIAILASLKSEFVKVRYCKALHRWLPVDSNHDLILDQALLQRGDVRDALLQLAEQWEDLAVPE